MGNTGQEGKPPVHPGKILLDGYMKIRNITRNEMREALGISGNQMSGIINGRQRITTRTGIKLGEVTGSTARLWLNLQSKYDIWQQRMAMPQKTRKRLSQFHQAFERKVAG